MSREDIEEAIEVLEDASAEMLTETGNENYYGEAIAALRKALETEREWVGLTDEEVNELVARFKRYSYVLLREVEAKLKEKNA